MAISRIVMGEWDKTMMERLLANGVTVEEAAMYVDDVSLFLFPVKLGWRWTPKGLRYSDQCRMEEEGMAGQQTPDILLVIMNTV